MIWNIRVSKNVGCLHHMSRNKVEYLLWPLLFKKERLKRGQIGVNCFCNNFKMLLFFLDSIFFILFFLLMIHLNIFYQYGTADGDYIIFQQNRQKAENIYFFTNEINVRVTDWHGMCILLKKQLVFINILSLEVYYSTFVFVKEGEKKLQYLLLSHHNTSRIAINENRNVLWIKSEKSLSSQP